MRDSQHGNELFRYIPKSDSVHLVSDINPGPGDSYPGASLVYNNMLYFSAYNPTFGRELFVYNGKHVSNLVDVVPGSGSSYPTLLVPFKGAFYFTASVDSVQSTLWMFDGGNATKVPNQPLTNPYDAPTDLTPFGDLLYFVPRLGRNSLWGYNGEGTFTQVFNSSNILSDLTLVEAEQALYYWELNSTNSAIVEGLSKYQSTVGTPVRMVSRQDVGLFNAVANTDVSPLFFYLNQTIYFAFEDLLLWSFGVSDVESSVPTLACDECHDLCHQSCGKTCQSFVNKPFCPKKCTTNCFSVVCAKFCF